MNAPLAALCLLAAVQAMPMTSHVRNLRCRDKQNRFYPVGYTFTREDGYKCSCSYVPERSITRLYCKSPLYESRGSASVGHGSAYGSSVRAFGADRCEYQGRSYALNTQWKMRVDGVLMDCFCNSTAHLKCQTGHITSTSRSTNLHLGYNAVADEADSRCQQDLFQENEYFAIRQTGGFYSLCTCHGVVASCSVPTASGEECMFPFELGGRLYSTCTAQGNPRRRPFCVTSRSGVSPQVVADCISTIEELNQYYGYVFTHGGNSNGARCHFPFSIGGVQHHTCQTDENGLKWCATTANYDVDQRYGFCMGERASDAVYNALGETAALKCRYNPSENSIPPTIKWYKLHGNTRQHIYTYDAATQTGGPAATAGFYASRISMPNANTLQIENMQYGDTGTFECEVSYPGVTTTSQRTDVSVSSSPSNFHFIYVPRISQVTFKWTNPQARFDQLRLELQQNGSNSVAQVRLSPNRNSHVIYRRFTPGVMYTARLYTITNGEDSIPAQMRFVLPVLPVRRVPGSSGETTLSAAQPLAAPRVQEDAIILNWYPAPLPDVQVTGWHVVYEDSTTREVSNVTLTPGTTSYTIADLTPGTVYRVTLYAIVDGNEVEIARTDATTEPTPAELSGPVQRGEVTETSVVLSWPAPTQPVTDYEISYRDTSVPGSAWQKYKIPASNNPRVVQRYLTPGNTYDFHITPYTNNVRGVYAPITITTPTRSVASPIGAPRNLRITDVTRSSFTARWEPGEGPDVRYYNISITPVFLREGDRPFRTIATHPIFYAGGLEGGRTYVFRIVAFSGSTESPETTDTVTTVNEVCEVEGIWRAADEKFFKRNPRGYMQNCTCFRKVGGGRWRCEPIICEVEGYQRTVDETWKRPAADGVSLEECTCLLSREISCVPSGERIPEPQRGVVRPSVGGRLELRCPHESSSSTRPTVEWSKVENGAERLLYVYHGPQAYGHEEETAGDMSGRISMTNEVDFIIEPVRVSDTGTYECRVIYPGLAPSVHLSTVSVTGPITDRTDTSLLFIPAIPQVSQTNPNYITITWERPPQEATSYIVTYTDITNNGAEQTFTVREPSARIPGLLPSTRYRITVIPVLNGARGEAMDFEITTSPEDLPIVTEAPQPVPPKSPTNLRFDSKGRTSITARWTPPYDLAPADSYRVEYKPSDSTAQPQSVETLQRYLRVNNLKPGQLYVFKVYAVRDGLESPPNTREVETSPVGRILVQASNTRRSNSIGSTATLYCRYDKSTPGQPQVTWVKLGGIEPELIFTYDTSTGNKITESTEFEGRLTSSDSSRLDISDLRGSDDGYYECRVTYPTGGGKGRTAITMVGIPGAVTFTSPLTSPDEDTHTLVWEVPRKPQPETFLLNVRRRGSSRQTYSTFTVPGGARSFRFRNLKPGKTYEGYMESRNSYGTSPRTDFYFTTFSASNRPNPPTRLELTNPSSNQVTVVVFGPSDVDYYRIRYSPENPIRGVPEKVAEGTSPTDRITLTEMVPGTPYVISVTSVLDNVESEALRAKLTTPTKRPPTPSDITVIEVLPRSITFEIVGDRTGVDQYEIGYRPTIGGTENLYRANPDDDRVTLTLEPDLQYHVTVQALNNEGGVSGIMRTVFTTPPEESPPDRPLYFTQMDASTDSVTLRWTGSTEGVQYYRVTYRQSDDTVAALRQTPGIQQAIVIPNLIPDSEYFVSVTAVGQGGHSPKLEGRFRTLPELTFGTSDVTEIGTLPDAVTIFVNPDVVVDYYIVRYRPEGETEEQEKIVVGSNITLHHLAPTTRYLVTLIAVKDNVESTPVHTTIETQPAVVVVPQDRSSFTEDDIISVGTLPDEVTFYLIPDESADYYLVNYRLDGQDVTHNTEEVLHGPNITLHHLLPSSRYIVTLVVVKDNVESSPVVTVVETPDNASTSNQPSQPTGLRQLGTSPTVVNFLIEGPTSNIDYYRVDWTPLDGSGTTRSRTNPNNDLTLTGLTPSTRYTVRVKAVYNNVESQPVTEYFVTDAAVPQETPLVGSITPTNLRVTRVGPDQATLEWRQPGGSDAVARYKFEYRETNRDYLPFTRKHVAATTPYVSLSNLVPDTDYTVKLTAIGRNRQRPVVTTTFRTMPEDLGLQSTTPPIVTTRPAVVIRTEPARPEPIPTDEPEPLPQPLEGPRGLVVDRRGDKDADIVWQPIGDRDEIDGFLVEYEPTFTRHGPAQRVILPNTATSANLPNLTPGTEYQVRVFTTRGDQQSSPTLATFISQILPPNNLRGIPGTDRVTVTWENPEGNLIGTRFETRKPGQSWRQRVFNTDVTSHVVAISPDDEQLEVRVTGIGQTIQSPPAETLVIIKAPDDEIFGEPITVDDVTDFEAVVTVDRDVVPSDGWILRLEDEQGIVGSPLNLTSTATTYNVADLQPGKKYRVVALSPRGDEIGVTEFTTKADNAKNIQTVATSPVSANISWEAPYADITGYVVKYRPVGEDGEWVAVNLTPDVTNHQITKLVPETLYEVDVTPTYDDTVNNDTNTLGMSAVHRFTTTSEVPEPTPPSTPPRPATNIRFTSVEPNRVTVNWSPSPDTNIDTHRVELNRADDGNLVVSSNLPTSYALFTRLEPDTLYEVVVTAIRGVQESSPLVGRVYTGKNAPSSVTVTDVTPYGVTVTWQPEMPENPMVAGYLVTVHKRDSLLPPTNYTFPAHVTEANLTELEPGTPYEITVTSIIDDVMTHPVTTTTTTTVPNPIGINFNEVTENSMVVTWNTPSHLIDDYVVDYWPTGNPDSRRIRVRNLTQATITNLSPGSSYTVSVHSVHNGRMSNGVVGTQVTNSRVGPPQNVQIEDVTDTSVVVFWEPYNNEFRHRVVLNSPLLPGGSTTTYLEPGENRIDLTELQPGSSYSVAVGSVPTNGNRMRQALPIFFTTKPSRPTNLHATQTTPQHIVMEWDHDRVSEFLVTYEPETGGSTQDLRTSTNRAFLPNLQPSTLYVVTVQAIGPDEVLSEAAVKSVWTNEAPPASLPENINVDHTPQSGTNSYLITWTLPSGSDDTYEIFFYPVGDEDNTNYFITPPGSTSHTLSGLRPGVEYNVKIHPVNSSDANNYVERTFFTVLPRPTRVDVSDVTETSLVVEWDAEELNDVDYYIVKIFPMGHPDSGITERVPSFYPHAHAFTGLEPGRNYQVDVTAHTDVTTSAPTTTYVTTTIEGPSNINAVVSYDQVLVTWDGPNDVNRYRVTVRPSSDVSSSHNPVFTQAPVTRYIFTDLQPNTEYLVDVVGMNLYRQLESRPAQGSFVTLPTTTPAPVTEPAAQPVRPVRPVRPTRPTRPVQPAQPVQPNGSNPDPLESNPVDEGSYSIRWNAPTENVRFYKVIRVSGTGKRKQIVVPNYRTDVLLNNLSPDTEYSVTVYAILNDNTQVPVGSTQLEIPAFSTDRSATIEWNQQTPSYESFRITATPVSKNSPAEEAVFPDIDPDDTHAWLTGLYPGTKYNVLVEGLLNGVYYPVDETTVTTAVDPPRNLRVLKPKPTSFTLRWDSPVAKIRRYLLTYQLDGRGPEMVYNQTSGAKATRSHVRNLRPGSRYLIRLYARSVDGDSPPAQIWAETLQAPTGPVITSEESEPTDSGVLVRWKSTGRYVQNWKVVVEPQDGSQGYERIVSRDDRRFELDNLKHGVAYIVKIYPIFGDSLLGQPRIINIPASSTQGSRTTIVGTNRIDINAFPWQLRVPRVRSDGVTLMWNQPWFAVQEYVLYIKRQSEPDSAFREVSPQPLPGQNMATISNLEPGEHYTLRLNATSADSHGHQSLVSTITINFSTLLPAITGVRIQSEEDGSILLTWDAAPGVDNYVVKYRQNLGEYTIRTVSASETSYTIPSPTPGTQYEIQFYAEKGSAHSHILIFTIDVPAPLPENCQDVETGLTYAVGASWNTNTGGFKLRCTCNAPQQYNCDTAEWCHADNEVYNPGEKWTRVRGINLKETCTCMGRGGYQCEPTNCHDQGRGYDEGQTWTAIVGNIASECVCRCSLNLAGHNHCQSTCQQPFAVLNERAKRELDEQEKN